LTGAADSRAGLQRVLSLIDNSAVLDLLRLPGEIPDNLAESGIEVPS